MLEFRAGVADVPGLHYTGPFIDRAQRAPVDFPWDRLDGRPLIYASLGTLNNRSISIFRAIAEACALLESQLVLSLGGGLDAECLGSLPGNPILVPYAPQLELLKRSAAVITHAGLNTVLESLNEGVPLVAIPQGNDQPGVAARIAQSGSGIVIPPGKLSTARLRSGLASVLDDPSYKASANTIRARMQEFDGKQRAADIIEEALGLRSQHTQHRSRHRNHLPAAF